MTDQAKKNLAIVAFALLYSAGFFWSLASSISSGPSTILVILLLVAALVWVTFNAFSLAVVTSGGAVAIIFIQPILLAAFGQWKIGAIIAALILLSLIALARWRIRDEAADRINYHAFHVFYSGTRWLIFGLLIAAAGLALSPFTDLLGAKTINIPEQAVRSVLEPIEPTLQGVIPGYSPLLAIAVTTDITNQYLNAMTHTSPLLSALVIAAALLLLLRLLITPLAWPVLALISLLVYIAQHTKLVHLSQEEVTVKHLKLL